MEKFYVRFQKVFVVCALSFCGFTTGAAPQSSSTKSTSKIDQKVANPELRKMMQEQMWGRFPRGSNPVVKVSPGSPLAKELKKSEKPKPSKNSKAMAKMPPGQQVEYLRYCAHEGRLKPECKAVGKAR